MIEVRQTDDFAKWQAKLRDVRAKAKIASRIDRLAMGNSGDVQPVGEGVSELRIHYGPDYRVLLRSAWRGVDRSAMRRRQELPGTGYRNGEDAGSGFGGITAMVTKTLPYDSAALLDSDEAVNAYMDEAMDSNDPAFIAYALGVVARARGMSQVAKDAGLSRESLYKALSADGNPEFGTVLRVMQALGLKLTVSTATPHS